MLLKSMISICVHICMSVSYYPSVQCEQVHIEMLTLHYTRQSPVVLELVERLLQHVLWVNLLHTQKVEHHVVG